MGIKGFSTIISPESSSLPLSNLEGSTVLIDGNWFLYKFVLFSKNIEEVFGNLLQHKFLDLNINPIFIFDGNSGSIKSKTITNRQTKVSTASTDLKELEDDKKLINKINTDSTINKYFNGKYLAKADSTSYINKKMLSSIIEKKIKQKSKKSMTVNKIIMKKIKEQLNLANIPFIHLDYEADLLCSKLVENGFIDYCISDDTDMFLYGCKNVIRNVNFKTNTFDLYNRDEILKFLNLNDEEFMDLCILLGTDYIPRTIGIKPTNILDIIHNYKSIESIMTNIDEINKKNNFGRIIYMNKMNRYNAIREHYKMDIDMSILTDINSKLQNGFNIV